MDGWEVVTGRKNVKRQPWASEQATQASRWQDDFEYFKNQAREARGQAHEHRNRLGIYGPQVAGCYFERGNDFELEAAKLKARAQLSLVPGATSTIDLHCLKKQVALGVVEFILDIWSNSSVPGVSLQFVTGVGRHSKDNVPVLTPAVVEYLEDHGWEVCSEGGTIHVTGGSSH